MAKVSIIIPSRNERYLTNTVDDIFNKATGDIEVIVILDGPSTYPIPNEREGLRIIRAEPLKGMRSAINMGAVIAEGKYLMKSDAHCIFSKGFDEILQKDCEKDWVVIASRYTLDLLRWDRKIAMPIDYFYLSCPWNSPDHFIMRTCPWTNRCRTRQAFKIDDTMVFQGSMWFMPTYYFRNNIERLESEAYGEFGAEQQEIAMKTWLSGGRVVVNKNVWYAHLHKKRERKNYILSSSTIVKAYKHSAYYWTRNLGRGYKHDFEWLIDKFWPLPMEDTMTYGEKYCWISAWKKYYKQGLLRK
jgi:glycosyltransferase involved in cell wall biosynthesis